MTFLLTWLSLLLAPTGCVPPSAEPYRPELNGEVVPFEADADGLSVTRGVIAAHAHAQGIRVDGPWDSLELRTTVWGRATPMAVDEADPRLEPDGTASADRGHGLVERWASVGEGSLEHGWELRERPDGDDPIQVRVRVGGAAISGDGDLTLTGDGGGIWTYGGVAAFDAGGEPLPATLHGEGDSIVVTVDDAGATWPITIDPLLTTVWATPTGTGAEKFGTAIATGDFNGDGKGDLAEGAPLADSGNGRVYVFYSAGTSLPTSPSVTITAPLSAATGNFGAALSVDRNPNPTRLWVGAPLADPGGRTDAGSVYRYDSVTAAPNQQIDDPTAGEHLGAAVMAEGNFDGDAANDLILGAPNATDGTNTNAGHAYVMTVAAPGFTRFSKGTAADQKAGTSIAVGRIDNNTTDDFIVGAPGTTTTTGRVFVYLGSSTFFTSAMPGATPTYVGTTNYLYGASVALGRFKNGGGADMVVGAPNGGTGGRVYWYKNTAFTLAQTGNNPLSRQADVDGGTAGFQFGTSVVTMGDDGLDTNNFDDLAIGGPGAGVPFVRHYTARTQGDGFSAGASTNWINTFINFTGSAASQFGGTLGAGDLNADTYRDLVIGASAEGVSRVYLGFADVDADGFIIGGTGDPATHDCDDNAVAIHNFTYYLDSDGDGFGVSTSTVIGCTVPAGYATVSGDCNDSNAAIKPGALETCNLVDDNCNGSIDEGVKLTFYADADADTYGNAASTTLACTAPTGYVGDATDCNDANAAVNPAATEVCNHIDDNCNSIIDEAGNMSTFYVDADADTYGNPASSVTVCFQPTGYVVDSTDCNDGNAAVNPGATEVCNTIDDNCNFAIDEGVELTFYADADGDGFGNATLTTLACTAPVGYVADATDCDDANAAVNPAATEVCNTLDDNCNGVTDEAGDFGTWYADADGDSYGNAASPISQCYQPAGYVDDSTDCNDANAAVNPGATEVCNLVDDNCNSAIDEGVELTWYADADGDGFGDLSATTLACTAPFGYVGDSTDCDDANAAVNPAATEVCNTIDDNCDALIDDADPGVDPTTQTTWYADADGDTFGNAAVNALTCLAPFGYVDDATDCNDADAAVNPAATEVCNTYDDDCNGLVDEAGDMGTWFADADGDLYGDASSPVTVCYQPAGYVVDATDCNDTDFAVNPAAIEVCNLVDDDCNGQIDEGVELTFYADADGDGFGNLASTTLACTAPAGYVADTTDCNDADGAVNPAATEVCNLVDDDCNGQTDEGVELTWYVDADGDGFGSAALTTLACTQPAGYAADTSDCDDGNAAVNPAATEVCNLVDDDCNGLTDEGVELTWYVDADGDGFGSAALTTLACTMPAGYADNTSDCNDADAAVNPAATEVCNTYDDDCNGVIDESGDMDTWFGDADGDGYGDAASSVTTCYQPAGTVADSTDCDDADGAVNPGATEICNTLDDDCNGVVDEAGNMGTWFDDVDGDGFGDAASPVTTCYQPAGWVVDSSDCNDIDSGVNPGETEICNTIDDNCDGAVDENQADADGDGTCDALDPCFGVATDGDGDGFCSDTDCRDHDPAIWPGAPEACDLVDSNCNGSLIDGFANSDGDRIPDCIDPDAADPCGPPAPSGDYLASDADTLVMPMLDGDQIGYAVRVADFNADGFGDLVASAIGDDSGGLNSGAVYVFLGPILTPVLDAADADTVLVGGVQEHAGLALAVADLDLLPGDDLAVGGVGVVRIVSGDAVASGGLIDLTTDAISVFGSAGGFGRSLATGDANGDGDADLLVGAARATRAYLFAGPFSNDQVAGADDAARFVGGGVIDSFYGRAVAVPGDMTGDGIDDVVVGAPGESTTAFNGGAVYIYAGDAAWTAGSQVLVHLGEASGTLRGEKKDRAGSTFESAGDLDGDGVDDLFVGGKRSGSAGAVWGVPFAASGLLDDVAWVRFDGPSDGDLAGSGLAVGDVNGDGDRDLLIGGRLAQGGTRHSGAAWLTVGPYSAGVVTLAGANAKLSGQANYGNLGRGTAVGDLDGDGSDDMVVGAYKDGSYATGGGSVVVFRGGHCP